MLLNLMNTIMFKKQIFEHKKKINKSRKDTQPLNMSDHNH